jgi:inorganic pyrophosphatase
MNIKAIPPINEEQSLLNVVIETPAGSHYKYAYDSKLDIFKIKKILPLGTFFPFDFGFIPNTKGGDGDPLDVLVIADQKLFPATLILCRPIGLLTATQVEKKKNKQRNDRIISVADSSINYADVKTIEDLNKGMLKEIESFFIYYNQHDGKIFTPEKWNDGKAALKLVKKSLSK